MFVFREAFMKNTIIIGAGVSGVFTALTLIDNGVEGKNITLIDKGNYIEKDIASLVIINHVKSVKNVVLY